MKFLKDTCIFLHKLNTERKIERALTHCDKCKKTVAITQNILDELEPGPNVSSEEAKLAIKLRGCLDKHIENQRMEKLSLKDNPKANRNYSNIRRRFYRWTTDPHVAKQMYEEGKIRSCQREYLKKVGVGECSLLAFAMLDRDNSTIVTEDAGYPYAGADVDIFSEYNEADRIKIQTFQEWEESIGFHNDRY